MDVATGFHAAQAVGAALYRRAVQGIGAHVQVSLLDTATAVQSDAIVDVILGRGKATQPYSVPAGTFATQNGFINVTSLRDRVFAGLCRAIERSEWLSDPRFVTAISRFDHADEINVALEKTFRMHPTEYWMPRLRENSVVCGPVSGYSDFLADPQVKHQQIFEEIQQEGLAPIPVPRVPGTSRKVVRNPAPSVGQHTVSVVEESGVSAVDIHALFESEIIGCPLRPIQSS